MNGGNFIPSLSVLGWDYGVGGKMKAWAAVARLEALGYALEDLGSFVRVHWVGSGEPPNSLEAQALAAFLDARGVDGCFALRALEAIESLHPHLPPVLRDMPSEDLLILVELVIREQARQRWILTAKGREALEKRGGTVDSSDE